MADGTRPDKVQIGCWSLILIALIVMFFSGHGTGDLEREVRGLRDEVRQLREAIDRQSREIERLRPKPDDRPPDQKLEPFKK
ncbi:MAG: hypothetical protein U0871_17390 [Gemmataceae bacterium]